MISASGQSVAFDSKRSFVPSTASEFWTMICIRNWLELLFVGKTEANGGHVGVTT